MFQSPPTVAVDKDVRERPPEAGGALGADARCLQHARRENGGVCLSDGICVQGVVEGLADGRRGQVWDRRAGELQRRHVDDEAGSKLDHAFLVIFAAVAPLERGCHELIEHLLDR